MEKNIFGLIKTLSENKVKFIVCGGVACFLHGVERVTIDLDISILLSTDNINKLITASKSMGLIPRIPEPIENLLDPVKRDRWVSEKGALVYTLISPDSAEQLDIFLRYPKTFEELYKNSDLMYLKGVEVAVSSKEDLIFAKSMINPIRDKDEWDIKHLRDIIDGKK